MLKLFRMNHKKKDVDAQIIDLCAERESCKERIREIRAEMQRLVERAADADDLDQKILSLDFRAQKSAMAVETERFDDLSDLIVRLQNVRAVGERCQRLDYIMRIDGGIDTDSVLREQAEIQVRREMFQESNRSADMDMNSVLPGEQSGFCELDEDFARLVQKARRESAPARQFETVPAAEMA